MTHRTLFRALLIVMATSYVTACAPDAVPVVLGFPSTETFLYTSFVRVRAFKLDQDELGDCPSLVRSALAGTTPDPRSDTGRVPVCDYGTDEVAFQSVDDGAHAWVALATNESNISLLYGCVVAEAYPGASEIRIPMFMTDQYRAQTTADPPHASVVAKCGGEL